MRKVEKVEDKPAPKKRKKKISGVSTSPYDNDYSPLKVEEWAREGANRDTIAKRFGISVQTLYKWRRVHPAFDVAYRKGMNPVDFEVENAFLKSCLGFTYKEITQIIKKDKNGKIIGTEVKSVTKTVPPNTSAAQFWLTNRKGDVWRHKSELDVSSKGAQIQGVIPTVVIGAPPIPKLKKVD